MRLKLYLRFIFRDYRGEIAFRQSVAAPGPQRLKRHKSFVVKEILRQRGKDGPLDLVEVGIYIEHPEGRSRRRHSQRL